MTDSNNETPKKSKSKTYTFVGSDGTSNVRVKHPSYGYIYENELTRAKVKTLRDWDKMRGREWSNCIIES